MQLRKLAILATLACTDRASGQGTWKEEGFPIARLGPTSQFSLLDNREHWPQEPCFMGSPPGMRIGLIPDGILLQLFDAERIESAVIRLAFEGASSTVELGALDPRPGRFSFFLGNDPARWKRNLSAYGAVRFAGLYPGVDLIVRGEENAPEYDLLVAPWADLSRVVVRCDGIQSLDIDPADGLRLETPLGTLHQPIGRCWQETGDGKVEQLDLCYIRIDDGRFGFMVPGRDPALALTIDPRLLWSTYLGGIGGGSSVGDQARDVAIDTGGTVTVVGTTEGGPGDCGGFPVTPGTYQNTGPLCEDVFVTRFRQSDGVLIYSSVIGGIGQEDRAYAVAVDPLGRATVTGWTAAPDFPTTPGAWDTAKNGFFSSFVLRLSSTGDDLEYSTFLDGSNGSQAYALAVTDSGSAIVGGETGSPDFPTTPGAYKTTFGGIIDAFLTRLDPTGSFLEWSTLLGGAGGDRLVAVGVDCAENVVATGSTDSPDFPTTPGAFDTQISMNGDAYVTRFDANGQLAWSTFLGGSREETGTALAMVQDGSVIVGGCTLSQDFPTTPSAHQPLFTLPYNGNEEAFVTRLDASGSSLIYSTFLGGFGQEFVFSLAVDPSGVATVCGAVGGPFSLTPGAFDASNGLIRGFDCFVTRLDPEASRLFYSTRLAGSFDDTGQGIAMSRTARVTVCGDTVSLDYPVTPDAFRNQYTGGDREAFVTTLDLLLQGVQQFGTSVPSCLGPINLNATEMPVAGASSFGFYCSGAPPLADGMLVVAFASSTAITVPAPERTLLPPTSISLLKIRSDAAGYTEIPFPLALGTQGMQFTARSLFRNTTSCPGPAAWSSSNGLSITVQ